MGSKFTSPTINVFCRSLAECVKNYLRDPVHRKEFEDWYFEKHGKPYVWKKAEFDEEGRVIKCAN